jgi:hypothetical protein
MSSDRSALPPNPMEEVGEENRGRHLILGRNMMMIKHTLLK